MLVTPPRLEFVGHEGYIPGGKTLHTEATGPDLKSVGSGCIGFRFFSGGLPPSTSAVAII